MGMGHFTTFDGKDYDFTSQCEYTLLETVGTRNETPALTITRKSFIDEENPNLLNGIPMTNIHIQIGENLIDLKEVRNSLVGDRVAVYYEGNMMSLPFFHKEFSIKAGDTFTTVSGRGFEVLFDGSRFYATVDPVFMDNTQGMCGTFNYNRNDDFMSPSGFIETDLMSFVESFREISEQCVTPAQPECSSAVSVFCYFLLVCCEVNLFPRMYSQSIHQLFSHPNISVPFQTAFLCMSV